MANSTSSGVFALAAIAAQQSIQYPIWAQALLCLGVITGLAAAVGSIVVRDRALERRIYWLGWLGATLCFAFAASPRGWAGSAAIGCLGFFAAVTYAYLRTPYLQIGGHTYSITNYRETSDQPTLPATRHSPAPINAYQLGRGTLSARNMWWILVALGCLISTGVCVGGWNWQFETGAVIFAGMGTIVGIDDGSRRLPLARGQYAQATLLSAASIPIGLAPVICYFLAYRAGRRWPVGPGRHTR